MIGGESMIIYWYCITKHIPGIRARSERECGGRSSILDFKARLVTIASAGMLGNGFPAGKSILAQSDGNDLMDRIHLP
jgi:hypothetical protein